MNKHRFFKVKNLLLWISLVFILHSPCALSGESSPVKKQEASLLEDSTNTQISLTKKQYWGGVAASILPGLGLGHYIQGREDGWKFTVTELIAGVGYFIFATSCSSQSKKVVAVFECLDLLHLGSLDDQKHLKSKDITKIRIAQTLLIVLVGLKIWEVVDAAILPSHYKIEEAKSFQTAPIVSWNKNSGFDWGFSFKYSF